METPTLLPRFEGLRIDRLTTEINALGVYLSATSECARCPLCVQASMRIHSHYRRTLLDMPWNRVAVRIHLSVRKLAISAHPPKM